MLTSYILFGLGLIAASVTFFMVLALMVPFIRSWRGSSLPSYTWLVSGLIASVGLLVTFGLFALSGSAV